MLAIYLLALCCYEGDSLVIDIPEVIATLCPYSDICNRSATADLNKVGKRPCCQECSCDKSCGMRLNCCFEEHDTYKLVERGLVACIAPFEGYVGLINKHSSFYMVQSCYDNKKDLNKPCRTRDGLGNSLIAPVSSTDTGYIYINDECAKCNGLVATKAWSAFFDNSFSPSSSLFHLNFSDSLMEHTSSVVFKPPAGESWHKMKCFKNYDSDLANCKNSELNDLCEYLNAPYETFFTRTVYKNIYCMMCQGGNQYVDFECESDSSIRGPLDGSFTMLLDWEAFNYLKQSNNRGSSPSATGDACAEDLETTSQDECLHVYCPEGQTETPKGCNHLGLWWYTNFFLMQIKLVPLGNERPSVSSLLQLDSTERKKPFSWIQPPCKKLVLTAMTVYYEILVNSTEKDHIKSFVVVFGRTTFDSNGFDPSVVVPLMQQCIDNTWRLRINKTTYMFSASFDEYTNYVQDGQQFQSKYSVDDRDTLLILQNKPEPAVFERISSNLDFITNSGGVWLRKTFFCKQVRLSFDKVEVDYGRIKIISKNITIGSNKYTFNYYDDQFGTVDKNKMSFSVCLDDYLHKNTSHGMCKRHSDFMILCTIVSWQFVISILIN